MIRLEQIVKTFNNQVVLNHLDLSFERGKIHGIVGDNGAGKTVLVNILSAVLSPDAGIFSYKGSPCRFNHPKDAIAAGISTIHQETHIVGDLSVAENIYLGYSGCPNRFGWFVSWKHMLKECSKLLNRLQLDIDPSQPAHSLNLGQQQLIKIARALLISPEVLIMDEPFTNLSSSEIQLFNEYLTDMQNQGMTIIYISHDIDDVLKRCDTITVLRDGKAVHKMQGGQHKDTSFHELLQLGEDVQFPRIPSNPGRSVLEYRNVTTEKGIADVTFSLRKGEILGIYGKLGSGKSGIARALLGTDRLVEGSIIIDGTLFSPKDPNHAVKNKIGYLPEDIIQDWIHEDLPLPQNLTLSNLAAVHKPLRLHYQQEKDIARRYINSLKIKTPRLEDQISHLSGGNKQKVAIAKLLFTDSKMLIFDEPTNHLDSSTKIEVYNLMNRCVGEGVAVIFISSDIRELKGMCDRILHMDHGICTERLIWEPKLHGTPGTFGIWSARNGL